MPWPPLSLTSPDALRMLVSDRVGVIRAIDRIAKGDHEPSLPLLYRATLGSVPGGLRPLAGVGKGETRDEALAGAVAEALERYCGVCLDEHAIQRGTLRQLVADAIDPREFILYVDEQYQAPHFPYVRFDENRALPWRSAIELPEHVIRQVPACLVYLRTAPLADGFPLATATSNGLAAGVDLFAAILGGILEVIERDSFINTWTGKLPARRLTSEGLSAAEVSILDHYDQHGVDVRLYLLPMDQPAYVVMALAIHRKGEPPAACVGLGCALEISQARRKAVFELCQVRHGETWRFHNTNARSRLRTIADVRSASDHSGYYAIHGCADAFRFLDDGGYARAPELVSYATGASDSDVMHCVRHLQAIGARVFYVDLTTPDLSALAVTVAKVLVTKLTPIHFGVGFERAGAQRRRDMRGRLGLADRERVQGANPLPHPLG